MWGVLTDFHENKYTGCAQSPSAEGRYRRVNNHETDVFALVLIMCSVAGERHAQRPRYSMMNACASQSFFVLFCQKRLLFVFFSSAASGLRSVLLQPLLSVDVSLSTCTAAAALCQIRNVAPPPPLPPWRDTRMNRSLSQRKQRRNTTFTPHPPSSGTTGLA